MAPTSTDLIGRAAQFLRTYDIDGLGELYRTDVLLDASVPQWRYQLLGRDALLQVLHEQLDGFDDLHVVAAREHRFSGGVTVEIEARYRSDDGEHLWREVHVLLGDDGGITEHTLYCTGIWDQATIDRHAVDGTMVRR